MLFLYLPGTHLKVNKKVENNDHFFTGDDPNPGGEILGAQTILHHATSISAHGDKTLIQYFIFLN